MQLSCIGKKVFRRRMGAQDTKTVLNVRKVRGSFRSPRFTLVVLYHRTIQSPNMLGVATSGIRLYYRLQKGADTHHADALALLLTGSPTVEDDDEEEIPAFNPKGCLLYTSPSPRDQRGSRMPSSA